MKIKGMLEKFGCVIQFISSYANLRLAVPGFGMKQGTAMQQHLLIKSLIALWGKLLCSCPSLVQCAGTFWETGTSSSQEVVKHSSAAWWKDQWSKTCISVLIWFILFTLRVGGIMLGTWFLCPACIACLNDVTAFFTAKEFRLNSAKWDALHTVTAKCRELQVCSSQLQVKILLGNAMDYWCPFLIAGVYIECSSSFKAVCGTEAQCVWLNSCSSLLSSLLTKQSTNKISTFLE